jgi:uncharacterized protein YjgD (DUF1641 family)
MTKETIMVDHQEIIARLDRLEAMLAPIAETSRGLQELRKDLPPQADEPLKVLLRELSDTDNEHTLEDLTYLIRKGLRSINNLTFALDQLENIIEFARTAEPLLKVTIPALIAALDKLERQGIFAMGLGMLGALERVAERHEPAELARLGDVLSVVLDAGCRLTSPESLRFLEQALSVPSRVDLDQTQEVTLGGMFKVMRDPRVRQGLGVLVELTRALGAAKSESCPLPSESKQSS